MKILYCRKCRRLVQLTHKEIRTCECGKVKGRYRKDRKHAEVSQNDETISMAIDNDSLKAAIRRMRWWEKHRPESVREDYQTFSSVLAWVRPNRGSGNPHSHKLKNQS
jgi:hypothetical protein